MHRHADQNSRQFSRRRHVHRRGVRRHEHHVCRVGSRTREIGTLRVLGFRRRVILASFNLEGAILAGIGGALGCGLALLAQWFCTAFNVHFGTLSFNTFSEIIFQFRITPALLIEGMIFAIVVGIIGSFFPAIRAARLPVIAALKAV